MIEQLRLEYNMRILKSKALLIICNNFIEILIYMIMNMPKICDYDNFEDVVVYGLCRGMIPQKFRGSGCVRVWYLQCLFGRLSYGG